MRKGSILVVGLVVVIFLALTVLLILAIYSQVTNNYALQQKKLLVSNVARSGAYTLAEACRNWLRAGELNLVNQLASEKREEPFPVSLPEFPGTIECSLTETSTGYVVKCTAKIGNVEDSYSLTLLKGLTFWCGIDSDGPVTFGNNLTIDGDILVRRGDLTISNNATVTGSVYLLGGTTIPTDGGTVTLGNNDVVIEGDVLAVGDISGNKATIEGDAIYAGSIDNGITVSGRKIRTTVEEVRNEIARRLDLERPPLPATPTFYATSTDATSAVKLDGNIISDSSKTYYTGDSVKNGLEVPSVLTLQIPSSGLLSIAASSLIVNSNTTINVEGTGVVMIYVENKVDVKNRLIINMATETRLLIYSNGYEDTSDSKKDKKDEDDSDDSGADSDFYFKNNLTVNGGGLYIYAPEKYVSIKNAANFNGAIVSKRLDAKNGLNFSLPPPFPMVFFDPEESETVYLTSYGSWGQ